MENEQLNNVNQFSEKNENTLTRISLDAVFADRGGYINELNLFMVYFKQIPNLISEVNINCEKAMVWFHEAYKNEIWENYYMKRYFKGSKHRLCRR